MKGYHYLMRLAHLLNTLARFSKDLAELFSSLGVQAAIGLIRNTLTGLWLDAQIPAGGTRGAGDPWVAPISGVGHMFVSQRCFSRFDVVFCKYIKLQSVCRINK